jgi:DNA-binding transcriptional LysR family regulator
MEYFVAVAEERSFSRAAQVLHVTQPALSQQVRALETQLGAPLLERLQRGVRLTAAGRAYLPHAQATLSAQRRGDNAVREVRAGLAGELELAAVMSVAVGVLLKALLRWRAEVPDVAVRLAEFGHRRLLEEYVAAGSADVAVGPTPAAWAGPVVTLGLERFVLVLPSDDPVAARVRPYRGRRPAAAPGSSGRLPLAALEGREWVLFERGHGLSEVVAAHLARAGLAPPRASLRTTQFVTAASLGGSGMGPTLLPANVVPADLDALVCEPDPPLTRQLSAFSRNPLVGVPARFVALLRETSTMLERGAP